MFNVLLDAATTEQGIGGMLPLLAVYAIFFVILYFVLIRPQRKRQKETTNMQNAIVNGDWVLLNNGMYGKVVNVVNDNLMVEFGTNRSIIIPVRRDQVLAAAPRHPADRDQGCQGYPGCQDLLVLDQPNRHLKSLQHPAFEV